MVEPPRRPTAEELEELTEAFRRDPVSAFVPLGEAFLALGRPRDAIDVGARGLKTDPASLAGRVMVAQAFAALHQWKEAQAELLKVVKADRNNGSGFRLLGEVLMRRADYERALPVLQHAQNLAPADPSVLSLLKRARAGQALDPPPPIPTPITPQASGRGRAAPARRPPASEPPGLDEAPTRVAGDVPGQGYGLGDEQAALGRMELDRVEVRREGPRAPVDRGTRKSDGRSRDLEDRRPVEVHTPPPREDPLAPLDDGGPRRGSPSAPPPRPGGPAAVRPRVMPVEKPRDAAQASLRQSAAVGEQYLNNLLTGGLLDVPRVRVPESTYDVVPDRRWGRSTGRMFLYLFVLLILGVGGAGGWYFYAEKQKAEDVARLLATAKQDLEAGDHDSLVKADTAARSAIERDRDSVYSIAVLAEITGLESMLYRELDPSEVDKAITLAAADIKKPTDEGYRELVIAKAANGLAALSPDAEGGDTRVADILRELKAWLDGHPDDAMARWMLGQALLAAGDRSAAEVAFEQSYKGGQGTVLGAIDLGNLKLDEGKYDEAKTLFDAALAKAPKHPFAFIGRSLVRSEKSVDLTEAMADLNVGVAANLGPRVEAFKHLALATAQLGLEDYQAFGNELDKAIGVDEPRYLARVGLLRVAQGRLGDAAAVRAKIRWYADKPQPDPLVALLDAELLLARGLPGEALRVVGKQPGLRAAKLRGRALFDSGQAADAVGEFADAVAMAPDDLDAQIWSEAAKLVAGTGDDRRKADEALDSLGRKAKSKAARFPHGAALAAAGKLDDARDKLELSLADLSDEYPNPIAYRSHQALAELDFAAAEAAQAKLAGKPATGPAPPPDPHIAAARAHLEAVLKQNPGYLPAHDLMGRLLVASEPDKAREHLIEVVNAGVASVGAELAYVRVILPSSAPEDVAAAKQAVTRARSKGASPAALAAVSGLFDAATQAELNLPPPPKPK